MIVFAHRHGFQCAIHAVGDRAIEACIDGFVRAQREEPRDLRHYLVHCDLVTPADIGRMVELRDGREHSAHPQVGVLGRHRQDDRYRALRVAVPGPYRCSTPACT